VEGIIQADVNSALRAGQTWRLFPKRYPQTMTTSSPRLILALTISSRDTLSMFLSMRLLMQQNNGFQNPGKSWVKAF
jgi:hypothetical protein